MMDIEELRAICDLTVRLTEIRWNGCNHLCVENFAPELFSKLIYEYIDTKNTRLPEIEELKKYLRNPDAIYRDDDDKAMTKAADALSRFQAENAELRRELEEARQQGARPKLTEE